LGFIVLAYAIKCISKTVKNPDLLNQKVVVALQFKLALAKKIDSIELITYWKNKVIKAKTSVGS
jgi:hypothetical protein